MRYWQNDVATVTEVARFPAVSHQSEGDSILRRIVQGSDHVHQFDLVTILSPLSEGASPLLCCRARATVDLRAEGGPSVVRFLTFSEVGEVDAPGPVLLARWGELRWFFGAVGAVLHLGILTEGDTDLSVEDCFFARPVEGVLALSADELEVFRLLGELSPILWPSEAHVRWFTGRSDSVLSGRRID